MAATMLNRAASYLDFSTELQTVCLKNSPSSIPMGEVLKCTEQAERNRLRSAR